MNDDDIEFEIDVREVPVGPQPPLVVVKHDLADIRFPTKDDSDVVIEDSHLDRVDFSRLRFWSFQARNSVFTSCAFSRISVRDNGVFGTYPASAYVDCDFDGADLRHIKPGRGRFERCRFTNVRIRDWSTEDASFIDCTFSGRLERALFYGRRLIVLPGEPLPPENVFIGNDLSAADLIDVGFRNGIDLGSQRLPDGPNYLVLDHWPDRVQRARESIASWEPAEQTAALKELEFMWNDDMRQLQRYIRRDDPAIRPSAVRDRVIAELERPLQGPFGFDRYLGSETENDDLLT